MQSSPSENNWSTEKTRNLVGTTKIPKRPPTYERVGISNPATKEDIVKKIEWKEKLSRFLRRDSERKSTNNFGTASGKRLDIKNRKGNPQEQSGVLKNSPKGQGV